MKKDTRTLYDLQPGDVQEEKPHRVQKRRRSRKWLWLTVTVLVVLSLVLTFALAPTSAVYVNGSPYHDTLWLRATEMFVDTSLLLLIAALAAVVYGYCRHRINRRRG